MGKCRTIIAKQNAKVKKQCENTVFRDFRVKKDTKHCENTVFRDFHVETIVFSLCFLTFVCVLEMSEVEEKQ